MRDLKAVSADLRRFLGGVRSRLRRGAWVGGVSLALALTAFATLVAILLAAGGRGDLVLRVGVAVVVGLGLPLALVWWAVLPSRRLRPDVVIARYVGARRPELASDLLSAVELGESLEKTVTPDWSRTLALSHLEHTAKRIAEVSPDGLVPRAPARWRTLALLAVAGLYAGALLLWPARFAQGFSLLTSGPAPRPFNARAVEEPILGDIALTLVYPAHTGRETRELPTSSGDLTAPPGTEVTVRARALRPGVDSAKLVFDGNPSATIATVTQADGSADAGSGARIEARFTVGKTSSGYRFVLSSRMRESLVEAHPHRIDVEVDRAPRVELYAPADELELESRRVIELGYVIDDDYGLGEIALVVRSGQGREQRKVLPLPAPKPDAGVAGRPPRSAQARFEWSLADLDVRPGVRIAYRMEAKDNDVIGGPNVGSSRTFYLKVSSPRERHEELISAQQALHDALTEALANRLERGVGAPGRVAAAELDTQMGETQAAQHECEAVSAQIARVHADLAQDRLAPRQLRKELGDMRSRLGKLADDEAAELARASASAKRGRGGKLAVAPPALVALSARAGTEFEKDVLVLDDLLARQRLENLLALGDEIASARDRVQKLLTELERTGSDSVRAELERELGELEAMLRQLAAQRGQMPAELADEYLNADAFQSDAAQDKVAQLRDAVAQGDIKDAARRMLELSENLDKMMSGMEKGLSSLRADKFSEEEQALGDVLEKLADLEADQRQIAQDAQKLAEAAAANARDVAKDKLVPATREATERLDKLDKQLGKVDRDALTPFSQEQLDTVQKRIADTRAMLKKQDLAEATRMAREAQAALGDITADLRDDLEQGGGWAPGTPQALRNAERAEPLAEQLVEGLMDAMPSRDQLLGPAQRRALDELARREKALGERAKQLAREAQKRGKELPGGLGQRLEQGIGQAMPAMERAEGRMKGGAPGEARREAEDAARRLGELRNSAQRASRPSAIQSGDGQDHEPVRIPGADDFKPPEAFRKDLLEAMKQAAPDAYREQVKRYYEELVK